MASKYLSPGGLLVLPGAAACVGGTPWAFSYGAMKAAVHQMVKSLGRKGSGLPKDAIAVGIAPVMLDTPANRLSMPDADRSTWTPPEHVADKLFEWASASTSLPDSGKVYKIVTKDGKTDFIAL